MLRNGSAFHQGALWVKGVEWQAGEEDATMQRIASFFEEVVPIDRVELTDWPERGAFVYLTGEAGQLPGLRQKAVETLDGRAAVGLGDAASTSGAKLSVQVADGSVVGVRALDDLTLEARLAGPVPYFASLITHYPLLPVPRHVIEGLVAKGIEPALWTRPEHIVSNGAYVLKEHHFRYFYEFEKNPRYWDAASVKVPKIRVPLVESYNTTLNLYRAGEFDWIGRNASLPSEFMNYLEGFDDFSRDPYGSVYFYWINTKSPPLDNPKLRRALSLAIDRQSLVDNVARGDQMPSADLVPDGVAGYEGLHTPLFDPAAARAMLKEAGYASGADVPRFTLIYNTSEGPSTARRGAPGDVEGAPRDRRRDREPGVAGLPPQPAAPQLPDRAHGLDHGLRRSLHLPRARSPSTTATTTRTGTTPEYDRMLSAGNNNPDPAQRLAIFREAEAMLRDATPMLPIYVYTQSTMVKPYLMGYWGNYLDQHPWKWFWIDERWYDGVPDRAAAEHAAAAHSVLVTVGR